MMFLFYRSSNWPQGYFILKQIPFNHTKKVTFARVSFHSVASVTQTLDFGDVLVTSRKLGTIVSFNIGTYHYCCEMNV